MEPKIKKGSIVFVFSQKDYKVGDIITFKIGNGIPITHRLIEIEKKGKKTFFKTKGDANLTPDAEAVEKENVLGKVIFSLPFLGYILSYLKSPIFFLSLIWIPAILIIKEKIKEIKDEKNHN